MNRIALLATILLTTLTLTACNEVTVNWIPELVWNESVYAGECHVDIAIQPSARVHFILTNCKPETRGWLHLEGGIHPLSSRPFIWSPNPRRIQNQYWVRVNLTDGRTDPKTSGEPLEFIGMLYYTW